MSAVAETISLPHGTIPTQSFGNVNLQNAMMYVNENFAAVKDGTNDAISAFNDSLDAKADSDHDHDDAYAALSHTHAQSEIVGLSSALDGKAELNHEHSQYLTSLPAHYHDVSGIQGLGEQLQAKAEKTHSHTIAQIENLATELGVKASTAYVDQQVSQLGSTMKAIADQEVRSIAVLSVDDVTPDSDGNVELNAVVENDIGSTVQAYSGALQGIASGGLYSTTVSEKGRHNIDGGAHYISANASNVRLIGVAKGANVPSAMTSIDGSQLVTVGTSDNASKWVKTDANGKLKVADSSEEPSVFEKTSGSIETNAVVTINKATGAITSHVNITANTSKDRVLTVAKDSTSISLSDYAQKATDPGSDVDSFGATFDSATIDTATWNAGNSFNYGLELWVTSRVFWDGTDLKAVRRKMTFDKNGMLYSVGEENANTVDTPTVITWGDAS